MIGCIPSSSSLIAPSLPVPPSTTRRSSKNYSPAFIIVTRSMAADRISSAVSPPKRRRTISASEARVILVFALASQAESPPQRLLTDLATETARCPEAIRKPELGGSAHGSSRSLDSEVQGLK